MSSKIYKTNLKIYYKITTNLPGYLQIWIIIIIIIIIILIKVYLNYLNVKNESALFVLQVIEPLNRRNFWIFSEVVITSTCNRPRLQFK